MIRFTMANSKMTGEPSREVVIDPDKIVAIYPAKDGIATTLTFANGQAFVVNEGFEYVVEAIEKATKKHGRR